MLVALIVFAPSDVSAANADLIISPSAASI
jgi:hypothetical protein